MELGCPRSQRGRGDAKQEVRKQGYRAKVRTKRKPLSLVSPDEAIPTLRVERTGDWDHPHGQALPWVQTEPTGTGRASLPRGHPAEVRFWRMGYKSLSPQPGVFARSGPSGITAQSQPPAATGLC